MEQKGSVNENLEPCILVKFGNDIEVEFVVDTGFNGSLCIPRSLMKTLNLKKDLEEEVFGVGLHRQLLDISFAKLFWFNEQIIVNALINDGNDRLLGSQLLDGKILNVNYQTKIITIND